MATHAAYVEQCAVGTGSGTGTGTGQKQRPLQTLLCKAYRWAANALLTLTEAPGNGDCLGLA